MNSFERTSLGELVEFQRGYDLPKSQFIQGVYPVRSSNGILGYHNEFKCKGPGITIGRSGTVGLPHYIKEDFFPHNTTLFIKDFKGNLPKYIYYLIENLKLNEWKSGSGVPTLNRNHLHPLEIRAYLSLENQKQIAKVLSDLDAKIDLNNKINQELEQMAKTIYDYWFVQFDFPYVSSSAVENDPQAHLIGKPYKSSGGKMVYNEELKSEIPEGWEVKKISNLIDVKDGTHDSPKYIDKGYKLITSKHLKPEGLDFTNANSISRQNYNNINKRSKVHTGDILFSMIGNIGTIYKVEERTIDFAIKNIALYKTSENQNKKNYVYMYLKGYDMQRYMGNVISGSIQKFIGLGSLRKMPLMIDEKTISNFDTITKSIFNQINTLKLENQKLAELRDWLLPMLMNGQVRVTHPNAYSNSDTKTQKQVQNDLLGRVAEE